MEIEEKPKAEAEAKPPRIRYGRRRTVFASSMPTLAREINVAHREVQRHTKGMLLEAKRAGDALIKAKEEGKRTGEIPHGRFKAWVEANTRVSYREAARYMRVAKLAAKGDMDVTFDGGIAAFLDAHAVQKPKAESVTPAFDTADAEHVPMPWLPLLDVDDCLWPKRSYTTDLTQTGLSTALSALSRLGGKPEPDLRRLCTPGLGLHREQVLEK